MKPNRSKWLWSHRTLSNLFVVCCGIIFYLILANFGNVAGRLREIVQVISPFVVGFAVAYLLNLPMRWLEEKVFRRFKARRGLSIFTVYLAAIVVLAVLLGTVLPQLVQSIVELVNNVQTYLGNLNELMGWVTEKFDIDPKDLEPLFLSYQDIVKKATDLLTAALPKVLNFGMAVGSGLVTALTALISSIYMLGSKNRLIAQLRKVLYAFLSQPRADRVMTVSRHANDVFAGFIGGKIVDSAIIGIICFIGMNLLGMPYSVLISVVVGVTNVIPFFGPFIGAVPSVMILLMVDPWSALKFAVFVLVLQQFDGNILGPKILGDSTGLSAIWVLVAIIVGGGLFGFTGMLLGVPTFAVLYSLMSDLLAAKLKSRGLDKDCRPLPGAAPPEEPPQANGQPEEQAQPSAQDA